MKLNLSGSEVPLLEFDSERAAVLEPQESAMHWASSIAERLEGPAAPVAAVACFFREVVTQLSTRGRALMELPSGEPLLEIDHNGRRLAVFYPGIGAPLAAYSVELAIAAGCRSIVACGGAGALQSDLPMGHHIITVTSAVRDEGTSFHYIPPGREILADPEVVGVLTGAVQRRGLQHLLARTWTTDALFRETPARIARRRSQGCLTVEMEASAMMAVCAFRGARFGQFLYAGDDLSGEVWSARDWKGAHEPRELLMDLAAEAALHVADDLAV